jgi:hypothetical protein
MLVSNIKEVLENIWRDKQQRNKQRREEMAPAPTESARPAWKPAKPIPLPRVSAGPTPNLAKSTAPVFDLAAVSEPVKPA